MYVKTPLSYAWRDEKLGTTPSVALAAPAAPTAGKDHVDRPPAPSHQLPPSRESNSTILWAHSPLQGKLGSYVAIRKIDGKLQIGIANDRHLIWVDSDTALTKREAQTWSQTGFTQSRPKTIKAAL